MSSTTKRPAHGMWTGLRTHRHCLLYQQLLMKLLTLPIDEEEHLKEIEDPKNPRFGQAIQKVMADRECELTLAESQQFVLCLIRLFELRALVFYDDDGNRLDEFTNAVPEAEQDAR